MKWGRKLSFAVHSGCMAQPSRPYARLEGKAPGTSTASRDSGWRQVQKIYASDLVVPRNSAAHEAGSSSGSVDPQLLNASLGRARRLCLAQAALTGVLCAALWARPQNDAVVRWVLLVGAPLAVSALAALQLRSLSYEAIAGQLRRAPPTFLDIDTSQPPLMQAVDVLSALRAVAYGPIGDVLARQ